jgi:hypothetical protein
MTDELSDSARAAIAAARAEGFVLGLGQEPGMVTITRSGTPPEVETGGSDGRQRLLAMMQRREQFRTAIILELRAEGLVEPERELIEGDEYPMAIVLQVRPDQPDTDVRTAKIKSFMAERYAHMTYLWEGEYIEMCNFDRYYAVTYSCATPSMFDAFDDLEMSELGIIDNIDFE